VKKSELAEGINNAARKAADWAFARKGRFQSREDTKLHSFAAKMRDRACRLRRPKSRFAEQCPIFTRIPAQPVIGIFHNALRYATGLTQMC
jgi:hypothetical protein